jgi:hypothetical protein
MKDLFVWLRSRSILYTLSTQLDTAAGHDCLPRSPSSGDA